MRQVAEEVLDEAGGRLDQVLAVVEQQEQVLAAQEVGDRGDRGLRRGDLDAQGPGDLGGDEVGLAQRRELDQPGAVAMAARDSSSATWSIRRVLPVPPTPTSVTSRWPCEESPDLGRLPARGR